MENNKPVIILVEAMRADADDYLLLEKKVGGKTYAELRSEKEFLDELKLGKIYLFKTGKKVIGHITCETKDDGSIRLGGFTIAPQYQGKGFGRQTMELILDKIKGAPKIDLVTHPDNHRAVGLYRSLGFQIVGRKENYFGDGEPRIIMEKECRPQK
jgi:ribosomal protein S18 acetylase RimI-like enzyme